MTRSDLIKKMTLQNAEWMNEDQMTLVVKTIVDVIKEALSSGDKVEIRGFGSFRLRTRKRREGRNPKTATKVSVPEKQVPFFKIGKELKELVNQ
ncbi:MAG: HU family DNA-binding protein [Nitrospirota bacterium]